MWGHLSEERFVDLIDGVEDEAADTHLHACVTCREKLQAAKAGLELARDASVPEPPPLYWQAFVRHVGRRIVLEPRGRGFGFWPALATAAALLAFFAVVPRPQVVVPASPSPAVQGWSALPPIAEDPGFALVQQLAAGDADLAALGAEPGMAALVAGLTDSESRALAEALRAAMVGRES